MPTIEFETTVTDTKNISIPESISSILSDDGHVKAYVVFVFESDSDNEEEKSFLQSGQHSFFKEYEDEDDYYDKKYGDNAVL
ncbi:MAG: hypothetical protein V4722_24205 [Bacteroidota bacterium]